MKRWLPMLISLAITPAMAAAQSAPPWLHPTTLVNDPNTSRLFFAPTGRALKRGETYVSVYLHASFFTYFSSFTQDSIVAATASCRWRLVSWLTQW